MYPAARQQSRTRDRRIIRRNPLPPLWDHLHRRLGARLGQGHHEAVLGGAESRVLAVYGDAPRRPAPAQLQQNRLPPRYERALACPEADGNAVPRRLAGNLAPGIVSALVTEAVAGVLVEGRGSRGRAARR